MYIKIRRPEDRIELLVNIDHITKIEVWYAIPRFEEGNRLHHERVTLEEGLNNPEAVRFYDVFVAGETIFLAADPNSKLLAVIEEIYKNALRRLICGVDSQLISDKLIDSFSRGRRKFFDRSRTESLKREQLYKPVTLILFGDAHEVASNYRRENRFSYCAA